MRTLLAWSGTEEQRGEPEEQCGGAVGHGYAGGDYAKGHANIGIEMILSSQRARGKTNRVTLRQIEFPTTLQNKVFANSQVGATKSSEKQRWTTLKLVVWRGKLFLV